MAQKNKIQNRVLYKDWTFSSGKYGVVEEYYENNAVVLAIRNILLAKPGNFPETPGLGMNIEKYQFDFLDDQTISDIENELNYQILKYVPKISGVDINIQRIDDNNTTYLGISISANSEGDSLTANFLILKEREEVKIYNEIF